MFSSIGKRSEAASPVASVVISSLLSMKAAKPATVVMAKIETRSVDGDVSSQWTDTDAQEN